ncbi:hypothetical protein GS894_00830 [Rhodococcus hoagii]|nr:hypothetical protein [Prescottella equi]NKS04801.1 hypothetical protein [Prescottella equi]NKS95702.1 hypothetical protein [Prescottella equi]NKT11543.1 hypothetical protein [Prescottella equi]NKT17177.1 hypothetical protein [Prescottella equi]
MANRFFRAIPDPDPTDSPEHVTPPNFARLQWERRQRVLAEGAADAPPKSPAGPIKHYIPGFDD